MFGQCSLFEYELVPAQVPTGRLMGRRVQQISSKPKELNRRPLFCKRQPVNVSKHHLARFS